MKQGLLLLIISICLYNSSYGQAMEKYNQLVKAAWELYENKEYKSSADKYRAAFASIEGKAYANDRYNAACSYALSGQIDSSFYHLFRLARNNMTKYANYHHISRDADLKILHPDERWEELLQIVKANKAEAEKGLDKELVVLLDNIYNEDQKYRKQIDSIAEEFGWESDAMKAHWELIDKKDSLNQIVICHILDTRGWLGADTIGQRGNSTLFLIIQHSDLETQLKYLPMMRKAVKAGNASASSLALLEDRVAMRQGERQIYGSQISRDADGNYFVSPIRNPENVDKRRAEVGLGPLAEYASRWNIEWDVEKHKKKARELEAEKK